MSENLWCLIPPTIFADPELSDASKITGGRVHALTQKHGYCFADDERLSGERKCSPRTVRRHVKQLVERGHFERENVTGSQGGSTRRLYPTYRQDTSGRSGEPSGQKCPYDRTDMTARADKNGRSNRRSSREGKERGEGENTQRARRAAEDPAPYADDDTDAPPTGRMHKVYLEEFGGDPPHPSLTDKRRGKYERLWEEHLEERADEWEEWWRALLRALQASDYHMSKRAYQMPESFLRNEERRERWVLEAADRVRYGEGGMSEADRRLLRRRRELADARQEGAA